MRRWIWTCFLLAVQCSPAWLGKDDNGFMDVCLEGAAYDYQNLTCEDPQPLIWPCVPLSILVRTEIKDAYQHPLMDAALSWNDATNLDLFCFECKAQFDVIVALGGGQGIARTRHGLWPGRLIAVVEVGAGLNANDALRVLAHELGHVLDLAHDESCQSIMYAQPLTDRCIWGEPGITHHDADLLYDLYSVCE